MNEIGYDSSGRVISQIIDHGDGTGTRTTYDVNGQLLSTETVPRGHPSDAPPTIAELVAKMDPTHAFRAITVGALLAGRSDSLVEALLGIEDENTAKPLLDEIVTVAVDAAQADPPIGTPPS